MPLSESPIGSRQVPESLAALEKPSGIEEQLFREFQPKELEASLGAVASCVEFLSLPCSAALRL